MRLRGDERGRRELRWLLRGVARAHADSLCPFRTLEPAAALVEQDHDPDDGGDAPEHDQCAYHRRPSLDILSAPHVSNAHTRTPTARVRAVAWTILASSAQVRFEQEAGQSRVRVSLRNKAGFRNCPKDGGSNCSGSLQAAVLDLQREGSAEAASANPSYED